MLYFFLLIAKPAIYAFEAWRRFTQAMIDREEADYHSMAAQARKESRVIYLAPIRRKEPS